MLLSIPTQIEKFFELQHFDLDVTSATADTSKKVPTGTAAGGKPVPEGKPVEEKRDSLTMLDEETKDFATKGSALQEIKA